jgi:hypothetical protein
MNDGVLMSVSADQSACKSDQSEGSFLPSSSQQEHRVSAVQQEL